MRVQRIRYKLGQAPSKENGVKAMYFADVQHEAFNVQMKTSSAHHEAFNVDEKFILHKLIAMRESLHEKHERQRLIRSQS